VLLLLLLPGTLLARRLSWLLHAIAAHGRAGLPLALARMLRNRPSRLHTVRLMQLLLLRLLLTESWLLLLQRLRIMLMRIVVRGLCLLRRLLRPSWAWLTLAVWLGRLLQ
jgi:hypothetical protein